MKFKVGIAFFALLLHTVAPVQAQQPPMRADDPMITRGPRPAPDTPPPDYPRTALRKSEAGETRLELCVDASGKGHSPTITATSGSEVLDDAAAEWASGAAEFLPAEIDGQAVEVCNYSLSLDWKLPEPGDYSTMQSIRPLSFWEMFDDVSKMPEKDRPVLLSASPQNLPYPPAALRAGEEGPVTYALCLDSSGMIVDIRLMSRNVHRDLSTMALSWLWSAKYSPAMRNGKRISVCGVEVTYEWKLPDTTPAAPQ